MVSGHIAWNSCLHSVTYLLLSHFVYLIPYIVCRISFIVALSRAETINRVWLIEYGKWNLVAVICILFITYSHFLTIWLHFVASCECIKAPSPPHPLWRYTRIFGHFCMHTKVICLHDDKFHTAPHLPPPPTPRDHFRAHLQQKTMATTTTRAKRERGEHKLKLKCLFTLRMNQ